MLAVLAVKQVRRWAILHFSPRTFTTDATTPQTPAKSEHRPDNFGYIGHSSH